MKVHRLCQASVRHSGFPEFTVFEGETGVTRSMDSPNPVGGEQPVDPAPRPDPADVYRGFSAARWNTYGRNDFEPLLADPLARLFAAAARNTPNANLRFSETPDAPPARGCRPATVRSRRRSITRPPSAALHGSSQLELQGALDQRKARSDRRTSARNGIRELGGVLVEVLTALRDSSSATAKGNANA
jgi:hypothetical protein